jgi:glycosyltransferase involved in cell wall biosynthesis
MRFVLIGNYRLDKQESMSKYAENLKEDLLKQGIDAQVWLPIIFFGLGFKSTVSGIGKWFGYIDKWLLYPAILRLRILLSFTKDQKNVFYHICDHSNAPYLACLPKDNCGITCHDVLAIRGAFGYKDAYCEATKMGLILQKRIFSDLKNARILTAVSELTMNQLVALCGGPQFKKRNWKVIFNSFNADFYPMDSNISDRYIKPLKFPENLPYLLCVGSGLPRKNRKLLIDMVNDLGDRWNGVICFAGQQMDEDLRAYALKSGLQDRIIEVVNPDHNTLIALYSACQAFIFPSFSEGFGWPLIEAQACGVPVIASDIEPMPEVSNGSALHANPYKPNEFATKLMYLLESKNRDKVILSGFINAKRFNKELIILKFIELYKDAMIN